MPAMISPQNHHAAKRESAPGVWEVARPLRDTSWWYRRKTERACQRNIGHCWHPDDFVDWWCCMCSAETDGMPEQRCVACVEIRRLARAVEIAQRNPITPARDERRVTLTRQPAPPGDLLDDGIIYGESRDPRNRYRDILGGHVAWARIYDIPTPHVRVSRWWVEFAVGTRYLWIGW